MFIPDMGSIKIKHRLSIFSYDIGGRKKTHTGWPEGPQGLIM